MDSRIPGYVLAVFLSKNCVWWSFKIIFDSKIFLLIELIPGLLCEVKSGIKSIKNIFTWQKIFQGALISVFLKNRKLYEYAHSVKMILTLAPVTNQET